MKLVDKYCCSSFYEFEPETIKLGGRHKISIARERKVEKSGQKTWKS
jgi:hypothetical protein